MDYKISRKKIKAKLSWFNIAKGYGCLLADDGETYFLYGSEIGGGMWGENADKQFTKIGQEYLITSAWVKPLPKETNGSRFDFFMGSQFRVKSIQTATGLKPKVQK